MASSNSDPLALGDLDPDRIAAAISARDKKTGKAPSELDLQKEARLAQKEARLNSGPLTEKVNGAKRTSPQDPPAAPPPPPKLDRSMLLDKIGAYRERFPHLKKRNNVTAKSSNEEILDELHYIEMQLGSSSPTNLGGSIVVGALWGIEKVTANYWNPLGLELNGLGTVAQQNMDQFQPIIDELMIKYGAGAYTSPEWRLALMIGATVITVNAANQNPDMARAVKSMNMAVNRPSSGKDL